MKEENHKKNVFAIPMPIQTSFVGSMLQDFFMKPSIWTTFTYLNVVIIYILILFLIAGHSINLWYMFIYAGLLFIIHSYRKSWKEKERRMNAHRIPFFADALANSLAVGGTLEQAFRQSVYYLRGNLKKAFEKIITKNAFGKDIGVLLRDLEAKFPRTGLKYLISLLEEYRDLGIGISPLLKQMADALKEKEGAEEKIQTILAGGSNYARLSIAIFGLTFLMLSVLLKDQVPTLLSPSLKPVLLFLVGWASLGMFAVSRLSSLEFVNHYALRPWIKNFMTNNQWHKANLLSYSGFHRQLEKLMRILLFSPLVAGVLFSYIMSWYTGEVILIMIGFMLGVMIARFSVEFYLRGRVEDQLIKTVEIFPDFLQVYIIGLNAGLNSFIAFQFAKKAIEGVAPELLRRELSRTKTALECGENHTKTWQRLADRLPFETVIDFCEIMIISPLHGESIVKSIVQMMTSYQSKKLSLVEKKANAVGQFVVPIIVLAFFPLFLFAVFAPLLEKISVLFQQ